MNTETMSDASIIGPSSGTIQLTPKENQIIFNVNQGEEVMRINSQGMFYKGVFIEDAGEAHKAFLEVMKQMKQPVP